jgi:hypothetical protein
MLTVIVIRTSQCNYSDIESLNAVLEGFYLCFGGFFKPAQICDRLCQNGSLNCLQVNFHGLILTIIVIDQCYHQQGHARSDHHGGGARIPENSSQ